MEVDATGSDELGQVADCLIGQIEKAGVRLELEKKVLPEMVESLEPDVIGLMGL